MADDELAGWRGHVFGRGAGRAALIISAALGMLFCANGLFADDYFHQSLMEGTSRIPGTRWDLFTFAWGDPAKIQPVIERGPYGWWTLPTLMFSFVRPLSCALANLDQLLFGRAFFWHHLHSVAWYVGLVATVTVVFRRALGIASPVAALAALLFAFDDSHTVVAGWLANRNTLVAAVPALLGVLAHVRWREQGFRAGLPLSLLGCAVGLAGGEAALGAIAYLVAYELTAAPGPWRTKALSLLPLAALGAGYVAIYRWLGGGASGSENYLDPLRDPVPFLTHAPARALALVGAQFLGTSADLWMLLQAARPALVISGLLSLALMTLLLRRLWPQLGEETRRGLRWLTVGAVFSLAPVLATIPFNRLLLMPSVGGAALTATVLWHGWRAADDRLLRWSARLFLVINLAGVLAWPVTAVTLNLAGKEQLHNALETTLSDEALSKRVFVFTAPEPVGALYQAQVRTWLHKPTAEAWVTISFAPHAHRLTRLTADTVELEVVDGRMLETAYEQLVRAAAFPVPEGLRVRLAGAELTVTGFDQGLPNRVRVRFDEDPDRGGYTLARWENDQLVPLVLPAVGTSMELPRLHGLLSP